jgi:hypothetical protein
MNEIVVRKIHLVSNLQSFGKITIFVQSEKIDEQNFDGSGWKRYYYSFFVWFSIDIFT